MKKRIVLAYSGGLDTSVCVPWLIDKGYEVVCFMADVGQGQDIEPAVERGKIAGASKIIVGDLKQEFITDYIWPAFKANALYENKYNLATALSRPLIAKALVRVAHDEDCNAIAHGCTGKGNDQVRLDMGVQTLDANLEILAPVRDWELKSREQEIAYAEARNIPIDVTKKSIYSIDQNLWGVSIECGVLENPWQAPPADCYLWTQGAEDRNPKNREIVITFEKGLPVALDDKSMAPMELIQYLNTLGSEYGIGRVDLVENRFVGIKSREIYESPAAEILMKAHQDLESITLDRMLCQYKHNVSQTYAKLVYEGYWFTDLKRSLDAFIDQTQAKVNGEVRVLLTKGASIVNGRKSTNSLYKETLATYTEEDEFDQSLAKGFINLTALPFKHQGSHLV
ncbi:MAG: argininosuccinate synthase [Candidatus Omnitrophota bacterium]|jgi:argininosuccinate synthase